MGMHHRKYASFFPPDFVSASNQRNQRLFWTVLPRSLRMRRCSPLLFPSQAHGQPDQRSRAAQDTDAIATEDKPSKSILRKAQAIASVRALGTSLATTDMIINDSYSTS